MTDGAQGLALGLGGLREYAVSADGGVIAITLVRAVGWLSRGDLRTRRGHAGTAIEAPSAQCQGLREYRYAVVPFVRARADVAEAARVLREAASPPWLSSSVGVTRSLATWSGSPGVHVAALRAGADHGTLVARWSTPAVHPPRALCVCRERSSRPGRWTCGKATRGWERRAQTSFGPLPPTAEGDSLRVRLAPHEIGTYLLQLSPERATVGPPSG